LLEYFNKEEREDLGDPTSAVADLYLKGGYYMDNDMRAVGLSCFRQHFLLDGRKQRAKLFQSFLASTPGNPILRKALDVMLVTTTGHTIADRKKEFTGMGTATLKDA
jgi:hypothetical protein